MSARRPCVPFRPARARSARLWRGPGCSQYVFSQLGVFRARLGRRFLSPQGALHMFTSGLVAPVGNVWNVFFAGGGWRPAAGGFVPGVWCCVCAGAGAFACVGLCVCACACARTGACPPACARALSIGTFPPGGAGPPTLAGGHVIYVYVRAGARTATYMMCCCGLRGFWRPSGA